MSARKLPSLSVREVVSSLVVEFIVPSPSLVEGPAALRVTMSETMLTVHDRWDDTATDFEIPWSDLREFVRVSHDTERWAKDARYQLDVALALRREAECTIQMKRGQHGAPRQHGTGNVHHHGASSRCDDA